MRRRHGVVLDFPLYAGVQCSSQYWFINIQGGLLRDIGAYNARSIWACVAAIRMHLLV